MLVLSRFHSFLYFTPSNSSPSKFSRENKPNFPSIQTQSLSLVNPTFLSSSSMDPSRRAPRAVIDPVPKFRQVGFFAPPERSQSGPPNTTHSSPPISNSLSPVMIPPPRHLSDNLLLHAPPASSPLRADSGSGGTSFDHADLFTAPLSPVLPSSSYSSRIAGDFYKGNGGKLAASSFPRGGFDLTAMKAAAAASVVVPASELTTVSVVNDSLGIPGELLVNA